MSGYMFDKLKNGYRWRPINGCPGRYTFAEGVVALTIQDIVGKDIEVLEENFTGAVDVVYYCHFDGGGLISYKKPDGYLHTLCNTDGIARKLRMLRGEK